MSVCVCVRALVSVCVCDVALPLPHHPLGSIDLHNCRINRLIPIWMIVYGVVSVTMTVVSVVKQCLCRQKKKEEGEEEGQGQNKGRQGSNCLEGLLVTFLLVWVFVGSGWVFPFYNQWQDSGAQSCLVNANITTISSNCCEPRTFLFAFGSLLAMYSLFLLCCIFLCVMACLGGAFLFLLSSDE